MLEPIPGKTYTSDRTMGAKCSAQPIQVIYEKMREKNKELRAKEHEELIEEEVVAARLYSTAIRPRTSYRAWSQLTLALG